MSAWPYGTKRWARLRALKLQISPLCETCLGHYQRVEPATVVDHIVAINDGGMPYPPLDKLRSQCASCHNRKTRIVEQLGKELTVKGCDINGDPLDKNHAWYR
jgi:5-methylcytosine-specific restriction enzyme A